MKPLLDNNSTIRPRWSAPHPTGRDRRCAGRPPRRSRRACPFPTTSEPRRDIQSIILESLLLVLIAAELVAVTPALSIPLAFHQAPAFDAISHGQGLAVAAIQPSGLWMIESDPGGPEYGRQQGFRMAG